MRCTSGVVGHYLVGIQTDRKVTNWRCSRIDLESSTIEGDSPVGETAANFLYNVPEYHGTREILWESGESTLQG